MEAECREGEREGEREREREREREGGRGWRESDSGSACRTRPVLHVHV